MTQEAFVNFCIAVAVCHQNWQDYWLAALERLD